VSDIFAHTLLTTPVVAIRDIDCDGSCRAAGSEECATAAHLVFPYRGIYVRHVGMDQAVAEANQVLFFNPDEGYRVSHPVAGGDGSLDLAISEPVLRELAPPVLLREGSTLGFRQQRLRIEPRAQVLVASLRHGLRRDIVEPMEAESLALTLVRSALGARTTRPSGASFGRQRLVDRVKVVLSSNLARRWTLTELASEVNHSPVYLTQVFQHVEGLPLYRYQLRLRLARALHMLSRSDDLTALSLDLGFSSHSHFSTAFRQTYGSSPSAFRRTARRRSSPPDHR